MADEPLWLAASLKRSGRGHGRVKRPKARGVGTWPVRSECATPGEPD